MTEDRRRRRFGCLSTPYSLAATWSEESPWLLTVMLQQLMGLAIGILCYFIAAGCSRRAALPAASVAMLLPQHILHSTRIMPDTLALLAVCFSGYIWMLTLRKNTIPAYIALYGVIGFVLSIGAVTKQVLLYSPVVYAGLLFLDRAARPLARLTALALMTAVFLILPLSWRAHNRSAFGLDAYSTQDAFEPLGRAAILAGLTDQQTVWSGRFTAPLDSLAMVDGRVHPGIRDSIYRARTREILRAEPVRVLVPHFTSWPKFFSVGYAHKILRSMRMDESGLPLLSWKVILALIYLVLLAGTCAGLLIRRIRRLMAPLLMLFMGWFTFSALIYGPLATTRYGLTFFWALAVSGTTALVLLREGNVKGEKNPSYSKDAADSVPTLG